MKTIYNSLLLLFVLTAPLLLSNCTRIDCSDTPPDRVINHDFGINELKKVPYSGNDTLHFLNKDGDTCIVRGTGKKFYQTQGDSRLIGSMDCGPREYDMYQSYIISYISLRGNLEFVLEQSKRSGQIQITPKIYGPLFTLDYYKMDMNDGRIDSITINNTQHYNVYAMFNYRDDTISYKALINQTEGILYLKNEIENQEFSIIKRP